jgi:DNA-binding NarL/FixJ family response regulator
MRIWNFMKKSVIVVEDDRGLREQLVKVIKSAADITCIGAFSSAEDALPEILARQPDVVLMDIKLPGMSGIDCVTEIKKVIPATQIIMVTVYEDSERIFRALKAGAKGYLVKSGPPSRLLDAIRDVHSGGSPMSSHIARKVVDHFQSLGPSSTQTENLTHREREVLNLVATGLLYKEIANQLNISITTVRTHIINVCEKLQVRNRVEAVARLQFKL